MNNANIESDGVLYKMQQEAIRQARDAASKASIKSKKAPPVPEEKLDTKHNKHAPEIPEPVLAPPKPQRNQPFPIQLNKLSKLIKLDFLDNLQTEDIILIGIILLLFFRKERDIELILVLLYILLA